MSASGWVRILQRKVVTCAEKSREARRPESREWDRLRGNFSVTNFLASSWPSGVLNLWLCSWLTLFWMHHWQLLRCGIIAKFIANWCIEKPSTEAAHRLQIVANKVTMQQVGMFIDRTLCTRWNHSILIGCEELWMAVMMQDTTTKTMVVFSLYQLSRRSKASTCIAVLLIFQRSLFVFGHWLWNSSVGIFVSLFSFKWQVFCH